MNRIVCFTPWMRFNNVRYETLLQYFQEDIEVYKYQISKIKYIGGIHYHIWRLLKKSFFYPWYLSKYAKKFDVLYTFQYDQIPYWPKHKKIIADLDDPTFSDEEVRLLSSPNVSHLVVASEYSKERFIELGLTLPITVIYQGVPDVSVGEPSKRERNKVILGYIAPTLSLSADNPSEFRQGVDNLDLLFDSLQLLDKEILSQLKVNLVGKASPSVKRIVRSLEYVELNGLVPINEVMRTISNFDIGLYPRTFILPPGRTSIKLVQYMMLGKPIIANNVNESAVVSHAECGIICEDSIEFAKAIECLVLNRDLRESLGNKGSLFAKENFLLSNSVERYKKVFSKYK